MCFNSKANAFYAWPLITDQKFFDENLAAFCLEVVSAICQQSHDSPRFFCVTPWWFEVNTHIHHLFLALRAFSPHLSWKIMKAFAAIKTGPMRIQTHFAFRSKSKIY